MVTLSGRDLERYSDVVEWLKNNDLEPADAEILRMALRNYHKNKIKKELGEAIDEHSPQSKG